MKLPHSVNRKLFILSFIIIILSVSSSIAYTLSDNGIRTQTTSQSPSTPSESSTESSTTPAPPPTTRTVSQSVPTPPQPLAELQLRLEYIKMRILHKLGLNKAPAIRTMMDHEAYTQILELRQLHSDPNKNQATRTNEIVHQLSGDDESDKLFLLPIKSDSSSATFNLTLDIDLTRYPLGKVTLFTKVPNYPSSCDNEINLTLIKGGATLSSSSASPTSPSSPETSPSPPSSSSSTTTTTTLSNASAETHQEKAKPFSNGASNPLQYNENTLDDEYQWREYDLTKFIMKHKWIPMDGKPMIVVETEPNRLHSALMTIEFNYVSASRRKRKVDCSSTKNTSSCCRESFYVNFTQIGWDNWIVQPPGYYANYCKGKCDISHARYHHTTVVQKYSTIINLCCSPREMSNISLIYVNEGGYLFQKNLANMVVESCDCAVLTFD